MNIAVRQLTPTQLAIRERHLKFRQSIAEKAEALKRSKLEAAVEEMRGAFQDQAVSLAPESFPAETDPPEAPIGTHWFGPTAVDGTFTLHNYPSVENIQKAVCKYFGISKRDMISQRRTRDLTIPRQIGYYICKELTPLSLPNISARFGGRDHTSALSGIKKIARLLPLNHDLAFDVAALIEEITGEQQ